MKFGKTFLAHQVPEWHQHYLNYKGLKHAIKLIHNKELDVLAQNPKADVLNNEDIKSDLAAFFFNLDKNIEKVDDFYNKKYIEYERRLKRISSSISTGQSPIDDDDDEQEEVIGVLLELRNCFRNLKWYGELNKRGFSKILKKLDKKTGTHRQDSYLNSRIYPLDFCNETDVLRSLTLANDCMTKLNSYDTAHGPQCMDKPIPINKSNVLSSPQMDSSASSFSSMDMSAPSSDGLAPPSSAFVSTSNLNKKTDSKSAYVKAIEKDDSKLLDKVLIKECLSPVLAPLRLLLSLLNRATLDLSYHCIDYLLDIIPVLLDSADISGRNFLHHHVIALGKQYVRGLQQNNNISIPVPAQSPAEFSYRLINTFGPDGINSNDCSKGLLYIFEHLPAHLKFAILQKDNYKRTPLHYAAQYGLKDVTHIILVYLKKWNLYDESISLDDVSHWGDCENLTPVHLAVLGTHFRTTSVLVDAMGKGVSLTSPELLHIATRLNCPKLIGLLLNCQGIDINYTDPETHETSLYTAARLDLADTVKFLLEKGADTEIGESTFGWTPVFVAASEGFSDVEKLLIDHGAKYYLFDDSGWTPREHAALRGHMDIVPMLTPKDYAPYKLVSAPEKSSPYNMKELATSIDRLSDHSETEDQMELKMKMVGEKSKKEQFAVKEVKSFGHKFLHPSQALVLITLGSTDARDKGASLELSKVPLSKLQATELDSALSLSIHTADPSQKPIVLDLPLDNTKGGATDPITFKCDGSSPMDTVVYFDIVPTYEADSVETSHHKVLGRAVAILRNVYTSVGELKKSLINVAKIPILESETLEVLGTVKFEIMLVTSFAHPKMTFGDSGVYWKSTVTPKVIGHRGLGMNSPDRKSLQLGENTVESFVAAASLGASYVEFDVQLTKDNVPVVYHDFLVAESGIDIPMHALTLEQFLGLNGDDSKSAPGVTRDDTFINERKFKDQSTLDTVNSRMKHTRTWKQKKYKGNSRGSTIASRFVTLAELFKRVPPQVGFNIEVKYPMLDESQNEDIGQIGPDMNHFVDTILATIFANKGKRNLVVSSFHPDICTMLSLKQPSIPVLFLTDSGCSPVADIRSSSLQNAIRFARKWNLLGIVTNATPIVTCPRLASVVKASGLVCFTYGAENNDPANAKLELAAGVDAVIVDSLLAVRKGLTDEEA